MNTKRYQPQIYITPPPPIDPFNPKDTRISEVSIEYLAKLQKEAYRGRKARGEVLTSIVKELAQLPEDHPCRAAWTLAQAQMLAKEQEYIRASRKTLGLLLIVIIVAVALFVIAGAWHR